MNKSIIVLAVTALLAAIPASAGNIFSEIGHEILSLDREVRLGCTIGGTSPLPLSAEIRTLNKYTYKPNIAFGVAGTKRITDTWGARVGVYFENKGMEVDAGVKNYHMKITRGNQELEGRFTGDVTTDVTEWMFTIPVQATYEASKKWSLRFGPYISFLTSKDFSGYAHNGYLRVGDPTGDKVALGDTPDSRGIYDFTPDMRKVQLGVDVGANWYFHKKLGIFADIAWGVTGVHHSNFKTIEQTLYPIFGTLGMVYKLK